MSRDRPHRPRSVRFAFEGYDGARSGRPGLAQPLPSATDPIWAYLGVPAPLVFLLDEPSGSVVGVPAAGAQVALSPVGGTELYSRNCRGLLSQDRRSWSPARGVEVFVSGDRFQGNATNFNFNGTSYLFGFIVRADPGQGNNDFLVHKYHSASASGYCADFGGAGIRSIVFDSVGAKASQAGVCDDWSWHLCAAGFDLRVMKAWSASEKTTNYSVVSDRSDFSTVQAFSFPQSLILPVSIVLMAVWEGTDAEEMIDNWSTFVDGFWKHGKIDDLTVDADCVVAVPCPGGAGFAIWGTDQARISDGGLVVHPARTQRIYPSIPESNWGYTNITPSYNAGDGLGGLRSAVFLKEDAIDATHYASISRAVAEGVNTFRCVIDADSRYRGQMYIYLPSSGVVSFDFDCSTLTVSNESGASGTITDRGGGQFELIADYTAAALDAGSCSHRIYLADNDGNTSYLGDGSSGFYVLHAQAVQAYDRGPLIPSTTAVVTSEAPVCYLTETEILRRLSSGRHFVNFEFTLDELPDADIPLVTEYGSEGNVEFKLTHVPASHKLHLGGQETGSFTLNAGRRYRARYIAYPDGTARVCLWDLTAGSTKVDSALSGVSLSAGTLTKLYLGCLNDESGQQAITIHRVEVH